jgi:6-phosphogluconate dehydrogenase
MIHNGIEYGVMAAYAEGLNVLKHANIGARTHAQDAETAPSGIPRTISTTSISPLLRELWRRGSVISSWLLDLTAAALAADPRSNSSRARCPIRVKDDGPSPPRSMKACRPMC